MHFLKTAPLKMTPVLHFGIFLVKVLAGVAKRLYFCSVNLQADTHSAAIASQGRATCGYLFYH